MDWKTTYQTWRDYADLDATLRDELLATTDEEALEDAFYQPMSFGTAGMRGVMGPGINRMNIYTVRQATAGLAALMEHVGGDVKDRGVAISYDSRNNSSLFAHEAARVLGAQGIKTYIFESLRPTPELSFAVRHLHTYAGIMITASHNPREYNGYKIYGEDGGQMPPKESDLMTSYVRAIKDLFAIELADEAQLQAQGLEVVIGEDVDQAYLENLKTVTVNADLAKEYGQDLKFVFTPLNGTGRMIGERALKQAGFTNYELVAEEAMPNGDFPGLDHPNPEFPEAFVRAQALGKQVDADLLIATDPDADRLGCAVRQADGEYQLLTGNQIGTVLLNYILEAHRQADDLPANATAVKSIVSTNFATKVAQSYGVGMVNVLTGFKWIADQIHQYETKHNHTFMFGFEESFGYLVKPFVRDKDAIQVLVLLAEVAAYYRSRDMNLYDGLQELFAKYGYFANKTLEEVHAGLEGPAKIQAIMTKFREAAPTTLNGHQLVSVEDFQAGTHHDLTTDTTTDLNIPNSNVLRFTFDDETWVAVRPSGTEPKVKYYLEVSADTKEAADQKLAAYIADLQAYTKG